MSCAYSNWSGESTQVTSSDYEIDVYPQFVWVNAKLLDSNWGNCKSANHLFFFLLDYCFIVSIIHKQQLTHAVDLYARENMGSSTHGVRTRMRPRWCVQNFKHSLQLSTGSLQRMLPTTLFHSFKNYCSFIQIYN